MCPNQSVHLHPHPPKKLAPNHDFKTSEHFQGEKSWKNTFMANKGITFTVNVLSQKAYFFFSVLMTKDLLTGQHFPILFTQWSLFSEIKNIGTIPNDFQH